MNITQRYMLRLQKKIKDAEAVSKQHARGGHGNSRIANFTPGTVIATLNGQVIGELQSISYNATREMAPVYEMGSRYPGSIVARGNIQFEPSWPSRGTR